MYGLQIEMLGPDSFKTAFANALLEVKRPFLVNKLLEPGLNPTLVFYL